MFFEIMKYFVKIFIGILKKELNLVYLFDC